MQPQANHYDVVICGAGLAGLTLARQLSMQLPSLHLLLIDRLQRPLPQAAFKVGESTVHPGGTYLCDVLQLRDYLDTHHIEKYGLRYFFGQQQDFAARAELGRSVYDAAINEHQIDRGIFENDLRQMLTDDGVELLEGTILKDIDLGPGDTDHTIHLKASKTTAVQQVTARWVIDATGRRQLLSRKLNLRQEFPSNCSASWVRVHGRFDVSNFVPADHQAWHERVSHDHPFLDPDAFGRYNSTNHIMGYGYWIWVIPLVSGHTSIGLVTHNDYHAFTTHNTLAKTLDWLQHHDPLVAEQLRAYPVLDFKAMANYAYTTQQMFSVDRWACTGEAGVFSDPFQSPGTDGIAIANCYIKELIHSDQGGRLTPAFVNSINQEFLDYSRTLTTLIQAAYPTFAHADIGTISVMWYLAWTMSFVVPNMRFRVYKDGHITDHGSISATDYAAITEIHQLGLRTAGVLKDWALHRQHHPDTPPYTWMNHWHVPFFRDYRNRMVNQSSPEWATNLHHLRQFAAAIFLMAMAEVAPEQFHRRPPQFVPNLQALSLEAERWQAEGLYDGDPQVDWEYCMRIYEDLQHAFLPTSTTVGWAA